MKTQFTFFCLFFAFCINISITVKAQVNVQDSLALVDLYNSTNGPSWYIKDNWLTTKPISKWYGVYTSNARIIELDLFTNNLTGSLPSSFGNLSSLSVVGFSGNQLSGGIPPELGNLSSLTVLDLSSNQLSGSIPPELGNLSKLSELYLNNNQLNGSIPPQLSNLSNLTSLLLFNNQLTGTIPSSFGNLSKLGELSLHDNQLSGNIPQKLGNLSKLVLLYLNNNQLNGSIPPELGNLSNPYDLDLNNNQLSGSIPSELGNLSFGGYNTFLNLSHNNLSGSLPPELGNLSNLGTLNLSYNQLSGNIPPELSNLSNIDELDLNNNQLSGSIPAELGNLSFDFYSSYNTLDLSYNKLSGSIPPELGNLSLGDAAILNLSHNQLSGSIPAELGNLSSEVGYLNLSHNQFTFDGMELIAQKFSFAIYSNQARIPVHINNNALSVSAGGTLSNNTYSWYKKGQAGKTKITGDSVFYPTESGVYAVRVQNKIANHLNLFSDSITYSAPVPLTAFSADNQSAISNNSFSVYPNPAKDILHVYTKGSVSISLLNQDGKILLTANITNTGSININNLAAGTYYIQNKITGEVQKIEVVH